ncbi:MAG: hypothetical protein ACE5FN_12300 [Leptospirillia bacterium]
MGKADARFTISARDRTHAAFRSVKAGLSGLTRAISPLRLGIAGLVGTAGFGAMVKNSLAVNDSLGKTAEKLGLTTTAMAGLRHAGELTGISNRTLDMGVQRLTRRVAEAASGMGEARDAIKELGLDAEALNRMGPEAAFYEIADAMSNVTNQGDRVRLTMKLVDSEAVAMVNTFGKGSKDLQAIAQEARDLGIALDGIQVAQLEETNDSLTRVKATMGGVFNLITLQLSPTIIAMGNRFVEAAKSSNGFRDQVTGGMQIAIKAVGLLGDVIRGLNLLWMVGKSTFLTFKSAILDGLVSIVESYNRVAEILPFMDPVPLDKLARSATEAGIAADLTYEELVQLANANLPSDNIDAFFASIKAGATEAAMAVADARAGRVADSESGGSDGTEDPALQRRLDALTLTLGTEEERIRESYQTRQGIIQEALNNQLIDQQAFMELSQANDDKRVEDLVANALKWSEAWAGAFDQFSQGIGDAVADAIMEQKSFSDAMKSVVRQVIKSVISGLIQIAVKKVVLAGVEKAMLAATIAANGAAAATSAAAWAPAAAAVSLATLGGNSAPAMAGMASTFALSESLAAASLAGVAHDGLDNVPTDGTYLLQKGEGVLKKQDNEGLRDLLQNGGNTTVNINISAMDGNDVARVIHRQRGQIVGIIRDANNENLGG